jgi:hypothetical protein
MLQKLRVYICLCYCSLRKKCYPSKKFNLFMYTVKIGSFNCIFPKCDLLVVPSQILILGCLAPKNLNCPFQSNSNLCKYGLLSIQTLLHRKRLERQLGFPVSTEDRRPHPSPVSCLPRPHRKSSSSESSLSLSSISCLPRPLPHVFRSCCTSARCRVRSFCTAPAASCFSVRFLWSWNLWCTLYFNYYSCLQLPNLYICWQICLQVPNLWCTLYFGARN